MFDVINFGAIATAWRQGGKDAALAELDRQGFKIVSKQPMRLCEYVELLKQRGEKI